MSENKKIIPNERIKEIIAIFIFLIPFIFLYYINYFSNERMLSILNQETSILNNINLKPIKENVYLTTQEDIEKIGKLIDKKSMVYASDNEKYTLILIENLIIRFQYSKSSKNNLMETVSFLKNHQTENECKQRLEKTSSYFINKTKSLLYPKYKKVENNNGYRYNYERFIGMNVPTMEFYCKGTMEIAKINIIKESFLKDYSLK